MPAAWGLGRHSLRGAAADADAGRLVRDLTAAERGWVKNGLCPGCHQDSLGAGPQGGLSINWYCQNPECLGRYNLAILPGGTVMLAEVIQESKCSVAEMLAGLQVQGPAVDPAPSRRSWWKKLLKIA